MQAIEHAFAAAADPDVLVGEHVVLHPVSRRDLRDLARVEDDPAWRVLLRPPAGPGVTPQEWLRAALRGVRAGGERCWVIRDRADGRLLGSTRYLNMDLANARLEVGSTWFIEPARGTVANPESKLLVLRHAFERLGVGRVHIQADVRNARSRAAIEALGATFEGVLRRHIVLADGTVRDTAVYSILAEEWPHVHARIAARAADRGPAWRAAPASGALASVAPARDPVVPARPLLGACT